MTEIDTIEKIDLADVVRPSLRGALRIADDETTTVATVTAEVAEVAASSLAAVSARSRFVLALAVDVVAAGAAGAAAATWAGLPGAAAVLAPLAWVALLLLSRGRAVHLSTAGLVERSTPVLRTAVRLGAVCLVVSAVAGSAVTSAQLLWLTAALGVLTLAARETVAAVVPRRAATRILVAGNADQVRETLTELGRRPHPDFEVAAVCVLDPGTEGTFDVPVGRGEAALVATATHHGVDAVVVLPHDDLHSRALQRLGWELEQTRTQLYVGTGLLDVSGARTTLTDAGGLRLLHVRTADHRRPSSLAKELWERGVAIGALVALSPVLVGIGLLVRRDSDGPAIFRQQRVGRDGRHFTMYKYRTMSVGAHDRVGDLEELNEGHGVLFKMRHDPRITRIGATLRRYSIDELPQLINVARGEMSLVGPRPALPEQVDQYDHDPRRRLAVKPGLTGLWQVSGRSELSWDDTVRLDLGYVDNWSLGLDASILLRTARAVVGHEGAY